ncbi:MAG: DEAD/DEAH box helicase, partial [Desulfatiglandales bacterium]
EELKGDISVGGRVLVPLRSRKELVAYVLGLREGVRQDLRPIIRPLEGIPLFPPEMIPLFEWLSSYYVYPIGKLITEILPFKGKSAPSIELSVGGDPEALKGLSEEERGAIDSISKRKRGLRLDLALIGEMLKKGYLSIRGPKKDFEGRPRSFPDPITLTRHQESALREIGRAVRESRFEVCLLHGVTGSGKTQVYIEAIKEALSVGRSAIILFPEISLGLYMESLLRAVFGEKLSLYHSHLGNRQRQSQWMGMLWGHYRVVLGARSAVFAPFRDIGVIIVDEEHEDSYKQESGLRYNGRDVAVLRGMISRCPVILGSATPSIRSYFNALAGKYHLIEMPERVEEKPLPSVELVDMASLRKETKTFVLISPRM